MILEPNVQTFFPPKVGANYVWAGMFPIVFPQIVFFFSESEIIEIVKDCNLKLRGFLTAP